jgi:ketosteroid isomerase-like protein
MSTADQIQRELEAFYKSYIDAFNREDTDRFGESFAYPYGWISGERGLSECASESDHQRSFGRIVAALKNRGWVRSGVDQIRTWPFADNLAMILSDVTRYKADGSALERLRACYTVRRDSNHWKIVTITEIKPPFLGPGELAR